MSEHHQTQAPLIPRREKSPRERGAKSIVKFLCETSLTYFSAVKKKPAPILLRVFVVCRLLFGIKFLCETSLTYFSAVKKKPTPIPLRVFVVWGLLFGVWCLAFVVCRLLFGVWYKISLRNFLNLFLSGVQKKSPLQ